MSAGTTPLRAVLRAAQEGAGTTAEISRRTGLDRSVVDAAVGHLQRTGRLGVLSLPLAATDCTTCSSGCVGGGCPAVRERPAPVAG